MASFRDRITQKDGVGVGFKRTGKPEEPKHTKHFVGVPKGHKITEEEALQMGRELFDAIASEQAKVARKKKS